MPNSVIINWLLEVAPGTYFRDKIMKKLVLTVALFAFMMGGVSFSATAAPTVNPTQIEVRAGDEIDKLLDEYEQYVEQYIKVYKKAKSGDMRSSQDLVTLADKGTKLVDKIQKATAKQKMTDAQTKRYMNLSKRLMDAVSEK